MSSDYNDEDAPLDPAVERVRRKMLRLMAISIGIMMVGLFSVIGAIIYKINNPSGDEDTQTSKPSNVVVTDSGAVQHVDAKIADIAGTIELPEGGRLVNTQFSNNRILLTVRDGNDEMSLWIYDIAANRVFAKLKVR